MLTSFADVFVSPRPYLLTPAANGGRQEVMLITVCLPGPGCAARASTTARLEREEKNKECNSMNPWEPSWRLSLFKGEVISEAGL